MASTFNHSCRLTGTVPDQPLEAWPILRFPARWGPRQGKQMAHYHYAVASVQSGHIWNLENLAKRIT